MTFNAQADWGWAPLYLHDLHTWRKGKFVIKVRSDACDEGLSASKGHDGEAPNFIS